jgi:3-hydroxyacyl-CoA dehydrogenase
MELPKLIGLDTIVTTNSTSLTSLHIAYIIALDRFLGLQFTPPIWTNNLVEIATLPQTENAIKDAIDDFIANIEMIPMHVTITTTHADNDTHSQLVGWP